jgi:hypothetical protein
VLIVPRKFQRILPHRFRRQRLHRRLKHRQSPRSQPRRLARLPPRLLPFILTERARTSIPQKCKRIDGPVSILPLNLHPFARRQMNDHRLRIIPYPRSKIRQRHKFQYRTSAQLGKELEGARGANGSGSRPPRKLPDREFRVTRRDEAYSITDPANYGSSRSCSYSPISLRRIVPAIAINPVPSRLNVPGSGTANCVPPRWIPPL